MMIADKDLKVKNDAVASSRKTHVAADGPERVFDDKDVVHRARAQLDDSQERMTDADNLDNRSAWNTRHARTTNRFTVTSLPIRLGLPIRLKRGSQVSSVFSDIQGATHWELRTAHGMASRFVALSSVGFSFDETQSTTKSCRLVFRVAELRIAKGI